MSAITKVTKPRFIWKHEFSGKFSMVFQAVGKTDLDFVHPLEPYDTLVHTDVSNPVGSRQLNVSLYASSVLTTSACTCSITGKDVRGNEISETIDHSNYTFSAGETRTLKTSKIYTTVTQFQFKESQPSGLYMKLGVDEVVGADIAAGSYYIRGDASADCLLFEIENKMNLEADLFNYSTSINAEGQVLVSNSTDDFKLLLFTAPNYTNYAFDYTILGFSTIKDTVISKKHLSTYQHKRGWYPAEMFETDSKDYSVPLTKQQQSITNKFYAQRLSLLTFRDNVLNYIHSRKIFKDETTPTNSEISFEEFWLWLCQGGEFLYYRDVENISLDGKYLMRDKDQLNNWILEYTTEFWERYRVELNLIKYIG